MGRFYHIFVFCLLGILSSNVFGQDKMLFLNGKELEGSLLDKTKYEFTFKNTAGKQFIIDKYRVFSYTEGGQESIVYEFDTVSGNFLKVEDMKMFVYGERDAHATYKPTFSNLMGLAAGGTAGFLMHRDQSFIYLPIPLVYTVTTLIFPTKVNQRKLKDNRYLKEDEYLRGHERTSRGKRTQGALKNSIFGMGAGFLIGLLVND